MHRTNQSVMKATRCALMPGTLVTCALLLLGCSKNDVTGVNSPPSGSFSVGVAGGLINTSQSSTILEFQVMLDGKIIQDTSYTPATNVGSFDGNPHDISRDHRHHTLTFKVVRQTSSSNRYSTFALVVLVVDPVTHGVVLQMTPSDKVAPLATPTQIDVEFDI
jgi:hypothetical protein